MLKNYLVAIAILGPALCLGPTCRAQEAAADSTRDSAKPAWVSRRDFLLAGGATVVVGVISLADERVARYSQRNWLQRSSGLKNAADIVQTVGDPVAVILSASLFVGGKLSHRPGLADASLHSTQAIVASAIVTRALKVGIGRARPNLTGGENAYVFVPGRGYRTDYNSLPSGHTTAAFAAASVFSAELKRTHPKAGRIVTPLLYGVASLVGTARIYNNRHWLSDVVGGAMVGQFVGRRIVDHAHAGAQSR